MCGIAGIIGENEQRAFNVATMLETIKHRGDSNPKSLATNSGEIGICRLVIVDRKTGYQPISNETNTLHIVFNGEIYNYLEIRCLLEAKGHVFKTKSDTEVVLHGFEEFGSNIFPRLDGMFAFVIHNSQTGEFLAARDYLGIKPLYYSQEDGVFLFASEIKALVKCCSSSSIKSIPPGCWYDGSSFTRYYEFPPSCQINSSENEIASNVRALLTESIRKRVNTELPLAIYFSGGIDSAIVLALAKSMHPKITAISIGYNNSIDLKYAIRIAKDLQVRHLVYNIIDDDLLNLDRVVYTAEQFEPLDVKNALSGYLTSRFTKGNGFKIALVGEGADEVFGGYHDFREAKNPIALSYQMLKNMHHTELQRLDRTSMAFGIEAREPFLDRALVEYGLNIPFQLKIKNGQEKSILRKAFQDLLPKYVLDRPKVPFFVGANTHTRIAELHGFEMDDYNAFWAKKDELDFFLSKYECFDFPKHIKRFRS